MKLIHTPSYGLLPKILAFSIVNLGLGRWALAAPTGITNPLKFDSFSAIVQAFAQIATMIALPIAVLFIVYSGFLYVTAQGNPTKVTAAHKTLLWSVVGTAIILGSWVIALAVNQFAQSLSR